MNSQDLSQTQETIENLIIDLIKKPMKDFKLIKQYLVILDDIDTKRRESWNNETFESYDNMVADFTSDDIPF